MKTLLNEKIVLYIVELDELFNYQTGVKTIQEIIVRINTLSEKYKNKNDPTNKSQDKFKGDIFEIFIEMFCSEFSSDPKIGINNFQPIFATEDYGVDAIGTDVRGEQCAIQIKFRSNETNLITYEELTKTYSSGRIKHDLKLDKNDTIWVFTTSQDANIACHTVFGNLLRIINKQQLAKYIDNNITFWNNVSNKLDLTIQKILSPI